MTLCLRARANTPKWRYLTAEGDSIIDHVAIGAGGCVDFSIYPIEQPGEVWNSDAKDPLNKFDFGYAYFPQDSVEWILSNVLNCTEESITLMRQEWENGNGWAGGYLQDGVYYTAALGVGGAFEVDIFYAASNGDVYRIVYDLSGGDGPFEDLGTHEVVVSIKDYEGVEYWSIYSDKCITNDEALIYKKSGLAGGDADTNTEDYTGLYYLYSETAYEDSSTTYFTNDQYLEFTREGDTYYVRSNGVDRALKDIGNNNYEYRDKSTEYDEEYVHYHFDDESVTWYGNHSSCLYMKE